MCFVNMWILAWDPNMIKWKEILSAKSEGIPPVVEASEVISGIYAKGISWETLFMVERYENCG